MLLSAADYARLAARNRVALEHGRLRPLPSGPPDRRTRALRIAGLLAGAAADLGGFASCELVVRRGRRPDTARRPDCCVVLGQPPVDGVLDGAPALVVELAPAGEAAWWLAAGTPEVWLLDAAGATVHDGDRGVARVEGGAPDAALVCARHPTLRLRLADVLPGARPS